MIKASSIRSLKPSVITQFAKGKKRVGIFLSEQEMSLLQIIGFPANPVSGDTILPKADLGKFSRFNAVGKVIISKDKPMETAYHQKVWHWKQWAGRNKTEPRSKIVDVPYKRYPRTHISPPGIEVTFAKLENNKNIIYTRSIDININIDGKDLILHAINLFLEIFGRYELFTENLSSVVLPESRRVNWEILPKGKHPWIEIRPKVIEILNNQKTQIRQIIENRWGYISKYEPEFVAIGRGGFAGYMVFGFNKKNLFILESANTGNATYVFDHDWEKLSQMTKAEIINGDLAKDRIVHREGWQKQVQKLMVN